MRQNLRQNKKRPSAAVVGGHCPDSRTLHVHYGASRASSIYPPTSGGDEGIRTPDPYIANVVLYQLSYIPKRGGRAK